MQEIVKKLMLITFGIFLCASAVQGDDAGQDRDRLKEQIRDMINAGIPEDDSEKINQMMMNHHFSHRNMIKAQQIVMDTVKEGLPFTPVINKAYEGIAKNAPDEAIVNAMEKTRRRYSYAYEQAKQITDNRQQIQNLGQSIFDGLQAGLSSEDADKIMISLKQQTRKTDRVNAEGLAMETFLAARTMARLGVASTSITDITCQAIQNKYNAEKMHQLQTRFKEEAMNTPPSVVAGRYLYSLHEGMMDKHLGSSQNKNNSGSGSGVNQGHGENAAGNSNGSGTSGGSGSAGSINSGSSGSSGSADSGSFGNSGGSSGAGSVGGSGGAGSINTGNSGSAGGSGGSGSISSGSSGSSGGSGNASPALPGGSGGSGGSKGPGSSKSGK